MAMHDKASATEVALELPAEIRADHGPVLFHLSGGCCDGSSPMCYPAGELIVGAHDVLLGHAGFSLDSGRERRFLTRSRICWRDGGD